MHREIHCPQRAIQEARCELDDELSSLVGHYEELKRDAQVTFSRTNPDYAYLYQLACDLMVMRIRLMGDTKEPESIRRFLWGD